MKDNSFGFNANMKKVTLDKNGAQVLLTVEDTDFLEVATQLSNTAGYADLAYNERVINGIESVLIQLGYEVEDD